MPQKWPPAGGAGGAVWQAGYRQRQRRSRQLHSDCWNGRQTKRRLGSAVCFPSSIMVTGSTTGESDRVSCDMQVAAGWAVTSPRSWGIPFLLFSALSGNHLTPCLSMPQLSTCFVLLILYSKCQRLKVDKWKSSPGSKSNCYSVQWLSRVRLFVTSMPGFPVCHQHPELAQTHVHWVGDAIQPSHSWLPPSPPAFNLSQHQGLFKWVNSSHQVAKVLEFQRQSFQWIFRTDFL